eukprot:NODE_223_length_13915_cov_0.128257.p7 type:complete len:293 gc:universal NODE_223_length_13915_cov_0.128257:4061-4939(+)
MSHTSYEIKPLLQSMLEEKGTRVTMKIVKQYLKDRNVEIPEKLILKGLVQDALENFDGSSSGSESQRTIKRSSSDPEPVSLQEINAGQTATGATSKARAGQQLVKKGVTASVKNNTGTSAVESKRVEKIKNLPKSVKAPSTLYRYFKAATITIPYKGLKSMSLKEQYCHLVDLLTNNFIRCKIELPIENKTTSKYYKCSDRKWTIDLCKQVAEELELKREMEELRIDGRGFSGEPIFGGRASNGSKIKDEDVFSQESEFSSLESDKINTVNKRSISSSDSDKSSRVKKTKME